MFFIFFMFKNLKLFISNKKILGLNRNLFYLILRIIMYIFIVFILFYFSKDFSTTRIFFILKLLFYYFNIYFVFIIIKYILIFFYMTKYNYDVNHIDNITIAIQRIGFLFVNITFFFVFLNVLGIKFLGLLTSISIFAVALVLIFKDYITNLLNGLTIMFSKDYKLREYIQIEESKGRINDITFLNVELKNDDGDIVYIPNSKFLTSDIINFSKSNTKRIKYNFTLPFNFSCLVENLEKNIIEKLRDNFKDLINSDNILVNITEIKKDEIHFVVEILVSRYNFKIETEIKKFLGKEIIIFINSEKNN